MDKSLDRTHLRLRSTNELIEIATGVHPSSNIFGEINIAMAERLEEYSAAVAEARSVISKSPSRAAAILQQLK